MNNYSRPLISLILFLLVTSCAPSPAPAVTPVASRTPLTGPTATPLPPQRKGPGVVLVTLAGARADFIDRYLVDGTMPTLARIAARGVKAETLLPTEPPIAAAAQLSMLTGASAARTGIVADNFRRAGQSIGQSVNGFEVASAVEPVWRSAMRFGAKAALIGYPPAALDLASQRADWMVSQGAVIAPSAQHVLKFSDAKDWKNTPASFSASKESRLSVQQGGSASALDVFVLALDTTDDKQENFDTWLLSRSKKIDENAVRLRLNEWATFIADPLLQSAVAFKVTDANPAHFAVYQTPLMLNQLAPLEFARAVTRQFGAPPAPADDDALARKWIDEGSYVQMVERQTQWLTDVAIFVYQQVKPDLLLLRLNALEDTERTLLLAQARQSAFAERGASYAAALRHAHEVADKAFAKLYLQIDFNTNALLIVSPYGMSPVHTVFNLNRWLVERKSLTLQRGTTVDVAKSKAYAQASGGLAHIYINLKGRDPNGIVEQADYEKTQNDLVAALKELNDPVDGQPIFARVLRRQELSALGLQSDNSGDIVAQARAGFAISEARDRNNVLEPATTFGANGYNANMLEMRGVFIATGAGIRQGTVAAAVRTLDVAPTIAALLRFTPPVFVEGKALDEVLK